MIGRGLVAAAALSLLPLSAWADDQAQPLEAGKENTGRVSVVAGSELFGRGPYDDETWELSINAVVREGDELFTEDGTYAELEMPGQIFVRLDGDTSIVLQRVSDQGIELALANGSVYVSRGSSAQPVLVQTFGGSVDLGGNSMARVGSDGNKTRIDVKVVKGSAEMRTDKTAIAVPAGKTLAWTRSGSRNETSLADDDFDRWNATREDTVRGISRPEHVAANAMGSYELEGAGTWVMIDGYYAWRPTVVVADWRPYSNGYWTWTEPWGWTWCDYYGWGYTTSHYGRWYHRSSYGWVWYPDPYWGASWVVWAAFGPHIGWAPCDYWGRPIYVYSYYSYYDYGAWCYSDADYFYTGGGYRPRGVRTSTSRTATMGSGGRSTTVGRSGTHTIRKFDQNTIREHAAVPVRDASRELTPKHVVAAAERGAIKGVRPEQRKGDFLARAVKEGGVRPEPWADRGRGGNDGAINSARGGDNSRGISPAGDRSGRDPVRSAEGWGTPGRGNTDNTGRDTANPFDRGNTSSKSNDRGGNNSLTPPSRSDTHDRGGSTPSRNDAQDRGWTPPPARSNDNRPSYTPPAREPAYTPPARNDNNNSRPAPQPAPQPAPRQDNDSGKKSNDGKSNDSGKKPRSGWSNNSASNGYSYDSRDGSSRGTSGYTYGTPRKSKSSSASSAPSYSAPSRSSGSSKSSTPSYSAPSRKSSAPSYSAPSYSAPSRKSSAPSYSAPSRSSGGSSKSYSAPKSSGGGSKSSGSSSSKSSGGSGKSSSSSSSKSSGKRK